MEQSSKKITGELKVQDAVLDEINKDVKNIPGFKEKVKNSLSEPISSFINILLAGAAALNASDLHLEPEEEKTKIRIRVDGILQDVLAIESSVYNTLLSRIKLVSGIKLNISDRPQDGRFSIVMKETLVEVRASSLPSEWGESVVLRILNPKAIIEMEALGLREDLLEILAGQIKKSNGMLIVTGPTGSGKSTTLYAVLKKIQKPEIKIITIEDPIEYHLNAISQTQVNPSKGYDFANGLKAIVRQDPDVILVGEIRDLETANISLQAALTGHLVLSTLHTNDAAGTIARMKALGAHAPDISSAVNMALAQRLARKVCKKCFKFKKISSQDFAKIKQGLKGLPKKVKVPALTTAVQLPEAKGCKDCNFTGYLGRTGIYEFFLIDPEIEKLILASPSTTSLRKAAVKKGMTTLYQDGLLKVLQGITTLQEIQRVAGE